MLLRKIWDRLHSSPIEEVEEIRETLLRKWCSETPTPSLETIGQRLGGLTRERARQLLKQYGITKERTKSTYRPERGSRHIRTDITKEALEEFDRQGYMVSEAAAILKCGPNVVRDRMDFYGVLFHTKWVREQDFLQFRDMRFLATTCHLPIDTVAARVGCSRMAVAKVRKRSLPLRRKYFSRPQRIERIMDKAPSGHVLTVKGLDNTTKPPLLHTLERNNTFSIEVIHSATNQYNLAVTKL